MRIAISGTHASGKSTLIEAFHARHLEYTCEPEPYAVLQELYGEVFAQTPTIDDFARQLEYQLEVITRNAQVQDVIFERCPVDFLAYMLSIGSDIEQYVNAVASALSHLDLIVYLPIDERQPIDVHEEEDLLLREEVDHRLREIFFSDNLDFLPTVIEARGDLSERVAAIERALR